MPAAEASLQRPQRLCRCGRLTPVRGSSTVGHDRKHWMRPAVVFGQLHAGLALTRALGRRGIPVHGVARDPQEFGLRSRYLRTSRVAGSDEAVLEVLRALSERPVLFPER